ncbi:hypothetical protein SprV_0200662300 [Sparganum proliferum]
MDVNLKHTTSSVHFGNNTFINDVQRNANLKANQCAVIIGISRFHVGKAVWWLLRLLLVFVAASFLVSGTSTDRKRSHCRIF